MPWENTYAATLLLEQDGGVYRIAPFIRRTTPTGETYLEPLPDHWGLKQLRFARVEVIPPPSTKLDAQAGELTLTRWSSGSDFGGATA